MSDGESSKLIEPRLKKRIRRSNDEFAEAIARIAVAQVCESVGFQGFQQSAIDTFADVACKYVKEVGKNANLYANLAGRTECNAFDIVQGVEDLNLSQGFVGAYDRDSCLSVSGIVKDLSRFVNLSEEIGFAYAVPSFPVVKERKLTQSFLQAGESPPTDVVPPWLPVFVDHKTNDIVTVPTAVKEETQQKQKVLDPPSLELEQSQARNESVFPVVVENGDNVKKEQVNNPFLAVPLQPGQKEISSVSLPDRLKEEDTEQNHSNHVHVSELDQSAPTNQAVKMSVDTEEGGGMDALKNRPLVQMKIQKRSLSTAVRPNDKGKEKVAIWFINDEVWDEKEKNTENLAKVAMDIEEHTANDSVVN